MERSVFTTIVGLFWPPSAPVIADEDLYTGSAWWGVTCILNAFPVAAVLHHGLIYAHQCMLQPFAYGYEVTWSVIWEWVKHDAALPWAVIIAFGVHRLGLRFAVIKLIAAPVFISFLPTTLWVWDIFVLDRPFCRYLHDGKFELWRDFPLRTGHFYVLGICIYVAFLIYLVVQRVKRRSWA
ncbi:MAG: hypothetical protein AB1696_05700 [Planctomycetota bacterium]